MIKLFIFMIHPTKFLHKQDNDLRFFVFIIVIAGF